MKKLFTLIIFVFCTLLVKGQETTFIVIDEYEYSPDTITVPEGSQITWTNQGGISHTVTSGINCTADSEFNSGDIDPAGSFTHTFLQPGIYPYFCQYHCGLEEMKGVVIVDGVNGVNSRQESSAVNVFPNPVSDYLSLQVENSSIKGAEIYNAIGAKSEANFSLSNQREAKVSTSNLEPGVYFVKVYLLNEEVKLVKFYKK